MTPPARTPGEFTGRHMLLAMIAFFGTVIAVNLTLATLARTSWTGLVVENAYVASQEFNERAAEGRAQAALHWRGELAIADGRVRYALADASGSTVTLHGVTIRLRRPAYEAEDRSMTLQLSGGAYELAQVVPDGVWIVEVDADIGSRHPYRDVRRIVVANGAMQ